MKIKVGFLKQFSAFSAGIVCAAVLQGSLTTGSASSLPSGIPGFPTDLPGGIPPILLSSDPTIGAANVALNTDVIFTFLVPMTAEQSITWSPNVTAENFTYTWSADGKILTSSYAGDFPANANITWTLDPAVFKDRNGTPLMALNNSGSFRTGSGSTDPNDPCGGGSTNNGTGSLSLFKSVQYIQTSDSTPVIDPDLGASFTASAVSPRANPFSEVSLQLPDGTTKPLESTFGYFFLLEQFESQAELDEAYPSGTYRITVKQGTSTSTVNLEVGVNGAPPVPQLTNFAQTQAFNPAADFSLQWLPFMGAVENDGIFLQLSDETGAEFHAPDPCIPIELPNTATSIVVPANTFTTGTVKNGSISFSKASSFDTNAISQVSAFASYSKTTTFEVKGSDDPQPAAPVLRNVVRQQDGSVRLDVIAEAGTQLRVEGSIDLKVWTPITTAPALGGVLDVTDSAAATASQRFYRATIVP